MLICALFYSHSFGSERSLSVDEAKAYYILEIARHLNWPNDTQIHQFKIGVLGENKELIDTLKSRGSFKIRGKGFSVELIEQDDFDLLAYALIFVNKDKTHLNHKLYSKGKNTLILVDGKIKNEFRLISLYTDKKQIGVKINRANLAARGFKVSTKLLELVGTRKDLSEQLRETESTLVELVNQVSQKEEQLIEIGIAFDKNQTMLEINKKALADNIKELDINKKELKSKQQSLSNQNQQLLTLNDKITQSQAQIKKNSDYILEQQRQLELRQNNIQKKKGEIGSLQSTIEKKQLEMNSLNQQFKKTIGIIDKRENTISTQKYWLAFVISISFLFLLMSYFLFKENKQKKKANTSLKELNEQLYELATTDSMTALYNRRFFLESAQKELQRQSRNEFKAVFLMIDIDNFKAVNDTYGHIVGDEVIKSIAHILKDGMRKYDLVGRMGGEEFAMMLIDCDIELAEKIAQRICDTASQTTITYEKKRIGATISIGVSQLSPEDINVEFPIVRSDRALYLAKRAGRNRVVVFMDSLAKGT